MVLVYNPVLKIMTPSRKKCKYVIYAANSEELKAFEVEKDIYENVMLCDSLYYGRKKIKTSDWISVEDRLPRNNK